MSGTTVAGVHTVQSNANASRSSDEYVKTKYC